LQNRLIKTSQTGGQWYSDISPFSIPRYWYQAEEADRIFWQLPTTTKKKTKNSKNIQTNKIAAVLGNPEICQLLIKYQEISELIAIRINQLPVSATKWPMF
jgi:hypothetical protein